MAEFQEVAKEYIRMCESFECICQLCPLNSGANDIYACRNNIIKNPVKYEYSIMQWAVKHPEPVYPSWIDWLMSEGVIPTNYMAANSTDSRVRAGTFYVTSKAFEHIPANIAQKLGIKPKEE